MVIRAEIRLWVSFERGKFVKQSNDQRRKIEAVPNTNIITKLISNWQNSVILMSIFYIKVQLFSLNNSMLLIVSKILE